MVALGQLRLEMDEWEKNYFHVLDVPRTATQAEVKKAFRKLSLEAHPDKNPLDKQKAEERFVLIQKAHETLVNDQQRDAYDRWGDRGLEWVQHSDSVAFFGLVETLVSVTSHFVGAYMAAVFMGRSNARVWIMGGFALMVATAVNLRFGGEDPLPVPGNKLTRDEKVRALWGLFPSYITSVCALQKVMGATMDERILTLLQQVVNTNQTMMQATIQSHAAAGRRIDPASVARGHGPPPKEQLDAQQEGGEANGSGGDPAQGQQQQQQQQQSRWWANIPGWVWFLVVSTAINYFSSSDDKPKS